MYLLQLVAAAPDVLRARLFRSDLAAPPAGAFAPAVRSHYGRGDLVEIQRRLSDAACWQFSSIGARFHPLVLTIRWDLDTAWRRGQGGCSFTSPLSSRPIHPLSNMNVVGNCWISLGAAGFLRPFTGSLPVRPRTANSFTSDGAWRVGQRSGNGFVFFVVAFGCGSGTRR